jgi:hypothetical protein
MERYVFCPLQLIMTMVLKDEQVIGVLSILNLSYPLSNSSLIISALFFSIN